MGGPRIREGEPVDRRSLLVSGGMQILPGLVWLLVLLALPMLGIGVLSGLASDDYGRIQAEVSGDAWRRLAGWDPVLEEWNLDPWRILARSAVLAGVTTLLCLVIGLPMALAMAAVPPRWRPVLLALAVLPACINLVIRTYAWQVILGEASPVAGICEPLGRAVAAELGTTDPAWWARMLSGWIAASGSLYPGPVAVYIGMVSCMLPFAVLPLYQSVERLDWAVVEAVRDCYGGRWAVLRHGILSQVAPGLVAALVLTLVPSLGMFVVSDLLGGAKYILIGNFIQQQFSQNNWPGGAAAGMVLVLVSLVGLIALRRWGGQAGLAR